MRVASSSSPLSATPTIWRAMSEALMARGILAKDTHGSTVRFAPPVDVAALEAQYVKGKLLRAITDEVMDAIAERSGQTRSADFAARPGASAPLG